MKTHGVSGNAKHKPSSQKPQTRRCQSSKPNVTGASTSTRQLSKKFSAKKNKRGSGDKSVKSGESAEQKKQIDSFVSQQLHSNLLAKNRISCIVDRVSRYKTANVTRSGPSKISHSPNKVGYEASSANSLPLRCRSVKKTQNSASAESGESISRLFGRKCSSAGDVKGPSAQRNSAKRTGLSSYVEARRGLKSYINANSHEAASSVEVSSNPHETLPSTISPSSPCSATKSTVKFAAPPHFERFTTSMVKPVKQPGRVNNRSAIGRASPLSSSHRTPLQKSASAPSSTSRPSVINSKPRNHKLTKKTKANLTTKTTSVMRKSAGNGFMPERNSSFALVNKKVLKTCDSSSTSRTASHGQVALKSKSAISTKMPSQIRKESCAEGIVLGLSQCDNVILSLPPAESDVKYDREIEKWSPVNKDPLQPHINRVALSNSASVTDDDERLESIITSVSCGNPSKSSDYSIYDKFIDGPSPIQVDSYDQNKGICEAPQHCSEPENHVHKKQDCVGDIATDERSSQNGILPSVKYSMNISPCHLSHPVATDAGNYQMKIKDKTHFAADKCVSLQNNQLNFDEKASCSSISCSDSVSPETVSGSEYRGNLGKVYTSITSLNSEQSETYPNQSLTAMEIPEIQLWIKSSKLSDTKVPLFEQSLVANPKSYDCNIGKDSIVASGIKKEDNTEDCNEPSVNRSGNERVNFAKYSAVDPLIDNNKQTSTPNIVDDKPCAEDGIPALEISSQMLQEEFHQNIASHSDQHHDALFRGVEDSDSQQCSSIQSGLAEHNEMTGNPTVKVSDEGLISLVNMPDKCGASFDVSHSKKTESNISLDMPPIKNAYISKYDLLEKAHSLQNVDSLEVTARRGGQQSYVNLPAVCEFIKSCSSETRTNIQLANSCEFQDQTLNKDCTLSNEIAVRNFRSNLNSDNLSLTDSVSNGYMKTSKSEKCFSQDYFRPLPSEKVVSHSEPRFGEVIPGTNRLENEAEASFSTENNTPLSEPTISDSVLFGRYKEKLKNISENDDANVYKNADATGHCLFDMELFSEEPALPEADAVSSVTSADEENANSVALIKQPHIPAQRVVQTNSNSRSQNIRKEKEIADHRSQNAWEREAILNAHSPKVAVTGDNLPQCSGRTNSLSPLETVNPFGSRMEKQRFPFAHATSAQMQEESAFPDKYDFGSCASSAVQHKLPSTTVMQAFSGEISSSESKSRQVLNHLSNTKTVKKVHFDLSELSSAEADTLIDDVFVSHNAKEAANVGNDFVNRNQHHDTLIDSRIQSAGNIKHKHANAPTSKNAAQIDNNICLRKMPHSSRVNTHPQEQVIKSPKIKQPYESLSTKHTFGYLKSNSGFTRSHEDIDGNVSSSKAIGSALGTGNQATYPKSSYLSTDNKQCSSMTQLKHVENQNSLSAMPRFFKTCTETAQSHSLTKDDLQHNSKQSNHSMSKSYRVPSSEPLQTLFKCKPDDVSKQPNSLASNGDRTKWAQNRNLCQTDAEKPECSSSAHELRRHKQQSKLHVKNSSNSLIEAKADGSNAGREIAASLPVYYSSSNNTHTTSIQNQCHAVPHDSAYGDSVCKSSKLTDASSYPEVHQTQTMSNMFTWEEKVIKPQSTAQQTPSEQPLANANIRPSVRYQPIIEECPSISACSSCENLLPHGKEVASELTWDMKQILPDQSRPTVDKTGCRSRSHVVCRETKKHLSYSSAQIISPPTPFPLSVITYPETSVFVDAEGKVITDDITKGIFSSVMKRGDIVGAPTITTKAMANVSSRSHYSWMKSKCIGAKDSKPPSVQFQDIINSNATGEVD